MTYIFELRSIAVKLVKMKASTFNMMFSSNLHFRLTIAIPLVTAKELPTPDMGILEGTRLSFNICTKFSVINETSD